MKIVPLLLSALASSALAVPTGYSVVVNGQVAPQGAIVVGGTTYVPLSVFRLLGVPTSLKGSTLTLGAPGAGSVAPGGANQRASLEGCLGATVFNGVWRMTVLSVKPVVRYNGQQKGYSLNLSWKNGTPKTISALNTGVKTLTLALADGTTLDSENVQDLLYKSLPQAAGLTLELPFWASTSATAAGLAAPSKLLVEVDAAGAAASGVSYTSATPSFRVRLDCQN